jgi:cellobiose phosphorylase
VLDESVTFLSGRPLKPEDDSYYDLPGQSVAASLYVHCVRAIQKSLCVGEHGLPFIGTGDWNDGMNMVGNEGKGESVWLGFFLYEVLIQFSKVAQLHGDIPMVDRCKLFAASLQKNLEKNGWDGEWYLRAWFDDGSPLGSAKNPECQIDSISQSWSVLSGAGDANRSRIAMDSVSKHLVNLKSNLIQLLNPPFDKSAMNPGYIKGYVPGVRENGGQYTHAAIWAAMAYAKLGDTNHAWELLTMINPINHAITPDEIAKYKVEPYVIAADVYAVAPHIGRGGWTWYTGSAGLMYRLIVESLLGLRLEIDKLFIVPCLPANWESFIVHYRYRETIYHITIKQITDIDRKIWIMIDSAESDKDFIPLIDDRQEHSVEIRLAL